MAQGLNIDEILLGLDEEKTAEEVFSDNLAKDKKDGKAEETEEKTAEEDEKKDEETEEKTAEEDEKKDEETEEKTAEEDEKKDEKKDEETEEKTAEEKKDLTTDEEDSRLKKLAAEMVEGGQIMARSFAAELNKIAAEDYNEDEKSEKVAEENTDSSAAKIITTLHNRYFGE